MTNITIKEIFLSTNYSKIIDSVQDFFSENYLQHIKSTVESSLHCRDFNYAHIEYRCPVCGARACKPVTCKTKFCTCCGKQYSDEWSKKLASQLLPCDHKHMLFTIPKELRPFFIDRRDILTTISNMLYNSFKRYLFDKHKIKNFGYITFFHTFGRKSNFNPHLHILISCGGYSEEKSWISNSFIAAEAFKKSWRYIVITALQKAFPSDKNLNNIVSQIYKNEVLFFINTKGSILNSNLGAVKYLGRYLARPPIAECRISTYDDTSVTYWYKDVEHKQKNILTISKEKFIKQLVAHIPPKHFKMVRRYGIYSRNFDWELKHIIIPFKKGFPKPIKTKNLTWAQKIELYIGVNPLVCLECGANMVLSKFFHKKYGTTVYSIASKVNNL